MVTAARTLAQVSEADLLRRDLPVLRRPRRPGSSGRVTTPPSSRRAARWWPPPTRWCAAGTGSTSGPPRPTWRPRLLTQNLADVAAMGAVPTALLVSLVADPQTPVQWAVDFARTLGRLAPRVVGRGGRGRPVVGACRRADGLDRRRWATWAAGRRCCAAAPGPATRSRSAAPSAARPPVWPCSRPVRPRRRGRRRHAAPSAWPTTCGRPRAVDGGPARRGRRRHGDDRPLRRAAARRRTASRRASGVRLALDSAAAADRTTTSRSSSDGGGRPALRVRARGRRGAQPARDVRR